MTLKIIGALFLLVVVSIILIGGLTSIQSQTNIGDTVINESSTTYDEYNELKNTTALAMKTAGYSPYLIILFILTVFAVFLLGAAATLVIVKR